MSVQQNILTAVNSIIAANANDVLPTTCPSGTLNDISVACDPKDFSFSGTVGDKTTTGYYATYSCAIQTMQNLANFYINPSTVDTGITGNPTETYSLNFSGTYTTEVIIKGSASGSGYTYTPEYTEKWPCMEIPPYQICATPEECFGNPCSWMNVNCAPPCIPASGCYTVPSSKECPPDTTIPSTYPGVELPINTGWTCELKNLKVSGTINITVSQIMPSGSTPIIISVGQSPPLYIYNLSFTTITLIYSSASISVTDFDNIDVPVPSDITDMINKFLDQYFVSFLNGYLKDNVIELN